MAIWKAENSMLTQVGVEILNKVKAGVGSITVTRVVAGSGRVSSSQLFQQTELIGTIKPMTISQKDVKDSGSEISIYITNADFTESFDLNQIGVFVTHPDYEGEQLYHISQCEEEGVDAIPALDETPISFGYSLFLEHGNSSSIELNVNPQGMVSVKDFEEFKRNCSSRTMLWENENMSDGLGSNDPQDYNPTYFEIKELADYDGFEIVFATDGEADIHSTGFIPFHTGDGSLQSQNDITGLRFRRYWIRKLLKSMLSNIIKDNYVGEDYTTCLVTFERGWQVNHNPHSSVVNSASCVPWRIYGIKNGIQSSDAESDSDNSGSGGSNTSKNVQSDWNQNDSTAKDYVKNRTHYEEVINEEVTITFGVLYPNEVVQALQGQLDTAKYVIEDEEFVYSRKDDSTTYAFPFYVSNGEKEYKLTSSSNSKETGIVFFNDDDKDKTGTVTFFMPVTHLHKLEEKYIPDYLTSPLLLNADNAETYLNDPSFGDEALEAIKHNRQILVRVPNADGGNYTANFSPIYFHQLPNFENNYLYLFFLKDEKQDLSALLGQPAGTVLMPVYGELKMLLSETYNECPLK